MFSAPPNWKSTWVAYARQAAIFASSAAGGQIEMYRRADRKRHGHADSRRDRAAGTGRGTAVSRGHPAGRRTRASPGQDRLLFRTRNSALWDLPRFVEDVIAVAPDGANALVERGVRLVRIDYLSIAAYDDPAPTHEILLRAGVVIVETLDLRGVEPGWYDLICLPLLAPGADGAPARALLIQR
jgi:hypothetical protein